MNRIYFLKVSRWEFLYEQPVIASSIIILLLADHHLRFDEYFIRYSLESCIASDDDNHSRASLPPTIGPTNWQQWKYSRQTQNDHATDTKNELSSIETFETSQKFPVSLSVSSLDESTLFCIP
jgi:hypothetical protein